MVWGLDFWPCIGQPMFSKEKCKAEQKVMFWMLCIFMMIHNLIVDFLGVTHINYINYNDSRFLI